MALRLVDDHASLYCIITLSLFFYITGSKVKVKLHHYICLKGHLNGSLEKA